MSRKTMKVEVEELTEVDVEGIALVKRGANRIPFRIIKRDNGEARSMKFNIADLFKSAPSEPEVPTIVGVILNKAAPVDAYRSAIEAEGLEILDAHDIAESDTHFLKFAEGLDDVDADIVKINEDLALVVTGLKKAFADMPDSNSFMENMGKTQFFPGMGMAMGVLQDTVRNIALSEEDNAEAVAMLSKALDDFKDYVVALAGHMPEEMTKFESLDRPEVELSEAVEDAADETVEDDKAEDETAVELADEPAVEVETSEAEEVAKADEQVEEEKPDPLEAVLAKLETLDSLNATLDDMHKELHAQGSRLEDLEKAQKDTVARVRKAEEDLQGTIPASGEHLTDGRPTDSGEPERGMFDDVLPFGNAR